MVVIRWTAKTKRGQSDVAVEAFEAMATVNPMASSYRIYSSYVGVESQDVVIEIEYENIVEAARNLDWIHSGGLNEVFERYNWGENVLGLDTQIYKVDVAK